MSAKFLNKSILGLLDFSICGPVNNFVVVLGLQQEIFRADTQVCPYSSAPGRGDIIF
jgi:hypothetical protein